MKKEEVKQCCAVCEYLYDKEKCPLYDIYNDSDYNCVFRDTGKFKMVCDEFQIDSKLVDTPNENINNENIRETIKNTLYLYVEDVKRNYDTPESIDYWTQEIMKNIKL